MNLQKINQSALGKESTRHQKKLFMCGITYKGIVEELQRLAKKGRSNARKIVNLVSFSPGTPRRVLDQQRTNERVSVRGIHWWTLGLDG